MATFSMRRQSIASRAFNWLPTAALSGVLTMRDGQAGGHAFDFDREVCVKCGMSRERFEDNGKPPCLGRKKDADRRSEHLLIPED